MVEKIMFEEWATNMLNTQERLTGLCKLCGHNESNHQDDGPCLVVEDGAMCPCLDFYPSKTDLDEDG